MRSILVGEGYCGEMSFTYACSRCACVCVRMCACVLHILCFLKISVCVSSRCGASLSTSGPPVCTGTTNAPTSWSRGTSPRPTTRCPSTRRSPFAQWSTAPVKFFSFYVRVAIHGANAVLHKLPHKETSFEEGWWQESDAVLTPQLLSHFFLY